MSQCSAAQARRAAGNLVRHRCCWTRAGRGPHCGSRFNGRPAVSPEVRGGSCLASGRPTVPGAQLRSISAQLRSISISARVLVLGPAGPLDHAELADLGALI
jgi:hypothetical protein